MKGMGASGQAHGEPPTATVEPGWRAGCGHLLLALLLAWLAFPSGASQKNDLLLVRSGETEIYSRTVEAIEQQLEKLCAERTDCPRTRSIDLPGLPSAMQQKPGLIVSLGHKASLQAVKDAGDTPQLHVLVSETQHQLHINGEHRVSALYLEQPLSRQLDFIRFLFPDRRRIGVLLGEHSETLGKPLEALTEAAGLDLHVIRIDSPRDIGKRLNAQAGAIDVLLALPDPAIYNRETLAGMFLTAYRNRIPVIGFSESMIRAGAIGGIYSSPATIGSEAAQRALELLDGRDPVATYPSLLAVRVNRSVAGALHIQLPTDSEIQRWKEEP